MELVDGRGINCGNEVYFDYVDGEVVMTMYRDMPGVRMDRRDPNVIKTFSILEWTKVQQYLMEKHDEVEGVFRDDGVEDEVEEIGYDTPMIVIDSEGKVHPPEASKVLSEIQQLRKEGTELPKMGNAEAILPENKVPAMSVPEKEKEENGKENNEGDGETETSP